MPRYDNDRFRLDDIDIRSRERRYERDRDEEGFQRNRGHSLVGVLSFVIALVAGLEILTLFVVAGIMSTNGKELSEHSPEAIIIGLSLFFGVGLTLLALVLGIIGLFQKSDKVFPILGTSMSGLILLGTIVLLCLGIVAG